MAKCRNTTLANVTYIEDITWWREDMDFIFKW